MIKKLRIKLILLTMASVILVLVLMMTSINVSNYVSTANDIDRIIDRLVENDGKFEENPFNGNKNNPFDDDDNDDAENKPIPGWMGRETAFETRFFTVKFDSTTDLSVSINVTNISISEERAVALAAKVINKKRGFLDDYRYRVVTNDNVKTVYFVDCETRLEQFETFRNLSILISIGVSLLVFIVIFILSKRIVKPISDAYDRQKRFITNAAHELKTPLTIISANNEMIEISNGESELTSGINKQIVRMNNMVKNLSALSKIDETSNVKRSSFNLVEALDDMLDSFKEAFEEKNKVIEKDFTEEVIYNGDEGLIRQLFSIILDNALKYSKTKLSVKAFTQNKKIIISFINDASKIELGNLDKCFERFYRFDETRASSIDGSGIGLSIAKEIVTLHKGDIHAIGHENSLFEIKIIL